jgi:hypothetical protein
MSRSSPEEIILKSAEVLDGYIFFEELASSLLQHKKDHKRRTGWHVLIQTPTLRICKTVKIYVLRLGRFESSVKSHGPGVFAGVGFGGERGVDI